MRQIQPMNTARFQGGIAAIIRSSKDNRYLLLKRSPDKDFQPGIWECVTGRVEQGEGFEDALHREVLEEIGVKPEIDFLVGTTHFYRGDSIPENELLGIVYCCSLAEPYEIRISNEHTTYKWCTPDEAMQFLEPYGPDSKWIMKIISRCEELIRISPKNLINYRKDTSSELG